MLLKCPECGKEVSTKAGSCPHCGCPIKEVQDKVVEGEVVDKAPEKAVHAEERTNDQKLIEQYEKEVAIYSKRRKAMITSGIIMSVVGLAGIIVFTILLVVGILNEIPDPGVEPNVGRLSGVILLYYLFIILTALLLTGGIAVIIVGAVPNSIKITKRQNKIRQLRGY